MFPRRYGCLVFFLPMRSSGSNSERHVGEDYLSSLLEENEKSFTAEAPEVKISFFVFASEC